MANVAKYCSDKMSGETTKKMPMVIAFSLSFQRDDLLARGMGFEHLRELLSRLTRRILRQGASIAYAGNWVDTKDNLTYTLLRQISAELEENISEGRKNSEKERKKERGKLYNHSAWPHCLKITPNIEAQWITHCRIVRITQQEAELAEDDIVPDIDAHNKAPRTIFNAAVTLSAMRRFQMEGMTIPILPQTKEHIPPVVARILLGGKVDGYSGFVPGIFEEALVTMQHKRPLYILGGFGGAAGILADAIRAKDTERPPELTLAWHKKKNVELARLLDSSRHFVLPPHCHSTKDLLDDLFAFVKKARGAPSSTLNTGLSDAETLTLLTTRDMTQAVNLVLQGLMKENNLRHLPA